MKNFLIIVLALGFAAAAFLTRPDRGEFERYTRDRDAAGIALDGMAQDPAAIGSSDGVEFKDYYLWTVVRKDGQTLYTGVFDHWVDNGKVKAFLPS